VLKKVIVIGGGPAGMMAAYTAAKAGSKVVLLEQNEKLGKKLFITGKGRCNVTNNAEMDIHFKNIVSNAKFLFSAYSKYEKDQIMSLLEENGCALKVERGERVFPVSDHSSDVISALQRALKNAKVEVVLHTKVKEIAWEEGVCKGVILQSGKHMDSDAVIIATGGMSYASTGSTGDGYDFARNLGHAIMEPKPALVPLETREEWVPDLMGLSLRNVEATLQIGKKIYYKELGEMLFTHFGVTGPLMLTASSIYQKYKDKGEATVAIDLKPGLSKEQLDDRLIREFEKHNNKHYKNSLDELLPQKMIPVIIELSGIRADKKCNEISKEERTRLCELLKHLEIHITGTRPFAEAIITQGGVSVKQVNPATMESKVVEGLYFAGEILDLDAFTGGFNLQIAWSTGALAGYSAAKETEYEF